MIGGTGPPCNIGPKQARRRAVVGITLLAVAVALVAWEIYAGKPRFWRLAAFPLLWLCVLAFLQSRARVCVSHARRGTHDMDAGTAIIDSPEEVASLRQAARALYGTSAAIAAVLTGIAYFVPL